MKPFSKLLAASAITLSLAALAAPANAMVFVDVGTSGTPGTDQVTWVGSGTADGTFTVSGITTHLDFANALYNDGAGQDALLTIVGATSASAALSTSLPNFTQNGIDGYFEFRSLDNLTVLLRGDFTNFWLTGITGDRSGNLTSVGGQLQLTSDVVNLLPIELDNAIFGFTNIHDPYAITGGHVRSFQANNLTGSFGGAIPEPATWGLMIMGFGGVGAMIRRRRQGAAFA